MLRKKTNQKFEECIDAIISHMYINGMHSEYSISEMKKELKKRFND